MSTPFDNFQAPEFSTPNSTKPRVGPAGWVNIGLSALLALGLSVYLLPQWRHNPDLPHGWFMPLVFVFLVFDARNNGTQRFLPPGGWHMAAVTACVAGGLASLSLSILYMAVLDWTHALVVLTMTGAACALLCALWLTNSLKDTRLVPFNWPAGMAIALWFLSIPMPPGTYATLTLALQGFVTKTVLALLHLFGIAAVQHGNILQLTDVTVGVEEACSGVRSLLSCIYTGLFLSATLVRRPWHRAFVIALAGPLAVAMNVVRSLALTLLAHRGVSLQGAWHDVTGYAVLGTTAVLLAGLALWLARQGTVVSENPRQNIPLTEPTATYPLARWPQRIVWSGAFLAATLIAFLLVNFRPAQTSGRTPPDLTALLPAEHTGWTVSSNRDLARFSEELQTKHLAETTYKRPAPDGGEPWEISVYLAYWPSGATPVSVVATHTPDACWPGSGWTLEKVADNTPPRLEKIPIESTANPFASAEHRLFSLQGYTRHVWYWHVYDGRVIHVTDVRSPRQLLQIAWHYGFRREGEQLFVRISSNQSLDKIVNEPILQEIFRRLAPFGL